MPAMTSVVLTDGEATDHTFVPRGFDANNVATLVKSSGVPIANERLTISRPRTQQGREKAVFRMTIPVVQNATVDGITQPRVVRTAYADVTFSFEETSTATERENVRKMVVDLLGDGQAFASALIDDLEILY
jgi:hypothetical protein